MSNNHDGIWLEEPYVWLVEAGNDGPLTGRECLGVFASEADAYNAAKSFRQAYGGPWRGPTEAVVGAPCLTWRQHEQWLTTRREDLK